jgi:hypothetical protein
MAKDLPPGLSDIAEFQRGVVSRAQILAAGLSDEFAAARLNRGSWQRIYPGVYATFSGELPRVARLWAAVLWAGPGAMVSHETAAEIWGMADHTTSPIHVTVAGTRRVRRRSGLAVHLSAAAWRTVHPAQSPPRTRVEETILDLWDAAEDLDEGVGWVTGALQRRRTTPDKIRQAMAARSRLRRRKYLAELLSPDSAGIHSVLEYRYVHNVERPHGLPTGKRQKQFRRGSHNEYRDALYEEYQTVVELDGNATHRADTRWRDISRDNAAAAEGLVTLRYGWLGVTVHGCETAAEIAAVLIRRGYTSARPCSAGCPVGPTAANKSHQTRARPAGGGQGRSARRAGGTRPATARPAPAPAGRPSVAAVRQPQRANTRPQR